MKELIGLKVLRIFVNEGEDQLLFVTDKGNICYTTYSECCSETWFADIIGTDNLIWSIVKDVEMMDLPEIKDGRTRQDEDSFYGVKIKTQAGLTDIIYRNSSNGYYGGYLEKAVLNAKILPDMKEITDDWSA